jgi:hypothetical protein
MTNGEACTCECGDKATIRRWVAEGGDYELMYRRAYQCLLFAGAMDTSVGNIESQMAHLIRNRL